MKIGKDFYCLPPHPSPLPRLRERGLSVVL